MPKKDLRFSSDPKDLIRAFVKGSGKPKPKAQE